MLVAVLAAMSVGVQFARPMPAQAFAPAPLVPLAIAPEVLSVAGAANLVGVATAGTGVAVAGGAVGYGIGWAGVQAATFVWQKYQLAANSGTDTAWSSTTGLALQAQVTGNFANLRDTGGQFQWDYYYDGGDTLVNRCYYSDGYVQKYGNDGLVASGFGSSGAICSIASPVSSDGILVSAQWGKSFLQRLDFKRLPQQIVSRLQCIFGTNVTEVTATAPAYASDLIQGRPLTAPALSCPSGTHAGGLVVEGTGPGIDGDRVAGWTPNPRQLDANDPFADCMANATAPCEVNPVGADGTPIDWDTLDPATGTPKTAGDPSPRGCTWGAYVLTTSECFGTPDPTASPTPTSTTTTQPEPSPTSSGPTSGPTTSPTTSPTPSASPTPGAAGQPDPTDSAGNDCFPHGWGVFNPLEWVYKPVTCALSWAFVPSAPVGPQLEQIGNLLATTPPFSWPGDFSRAFFPTPTTFAGYVAPCPNWVVQVGSFKANVVCDSSYVRALQAGRPLLLAFMVLVAVAPLMRSLFYAVMPFIRPVPTS